MRLPDKLGKLNFHEDLKKVFESMTTKIKNTSEKLTRTFTETSVENNKALESLNEKVLELMNDKGTISPSLASSLVDLCKQENKSQFKLLKDPNSIRMNNFSKNTS